MANLSSRSADKFITGNHDGSVTLFIGDKLIKTKKLSGRSTLVDYVNGQVVAALQNGQVTILNDDLEIIKEISRIGGRPEMISGNDNYVAISDDSGSVLYFRPDSTSKPKVRSCNILLD